MSDVKMMNIPSMNVNRLIDTLSEAYCALINGGRQLKLFPSVMHFHGQNSQMRLPATVHSHSQRITKFPQHSAVTTHMK